MNTTNNAVNTTKQDIKKRVLFIILAIIVFRIGAHVPVPGIDPHGLAQFFEQANKTIFGMFNMLSGGALQRFTVFALGIMPYISASIIMNLMSVVSPNLEQLKKEGASGRKKINQYTRYFTVVLALFQAIGIAKFLSSQGLAIIPGFLFYFVVAITLVTGTMFLMWLGEQITERGIGNGISIIILAGILSGLPNALAKTYKQIQEGTLQSIMLILLALMVFAVIYFVVFMERGQRKIPIHYAKRQQGRKVFSAQSSYLPLKINMAGVIPPIFASSIMLFPATISQFFAGGSGEQSYSQYLLTEISRVLSPGHPLYILVISVAIIFFAFFYTGLVYSPKETADNLKQSGAFIPGIRPGQKTSEFIDKIMSRLTMVGALYLVLVSLLPEIMVLGWDVPFYFGGTSLLIIVVVIMDFMTQIQGMLMSLQYQSLTKKLNLKK